MADFAKVGEATFNSLQKAIDSIETEGKIEIINDAYIRSSATVPSTKNIEMDFKGYTLTTSQPLNVQGTLKVTDTSDTLTGTIKSDTNKAINVSSGATVTIDKLNIVSSYGSYVITNAGNLTINDIKIEGKYGISNTSTFIMNDGVINVTGVALYEQATSTLNGGTITTKSSEASLIISPGTVTISGANITNEVGLAVALGGSYYAGNIKLDSGSIKAKTNAVDACRGSFEINGGTIEAGGAGINRTCGWSFGGKMTGGYVKTGTTGITVSQGTFNFTGGKIESSEGYGLYVAANDGVTVNIGTKNEAADITNPEFIGKTYGVYIHSGTVNLYDGILKGQTGGYYGNISSIEDGYLIASGTETINEAVYNTNYLSEETEVAQIGTTKYKNIQTAIDEASSGDTITMIDDATIYYPLTISSDDDITFDLAGYSLSTAKTITNQGNITFVDSLGTSKVNPINPIKLFVNNKTMKFKSINIENSITTNDLITNNTDSSLVLEDATIDSLSGIYTKGTTAVTNSNINIKNDHVIENYGSLSVDKGSYITTTSYHSIYHSNAAGTLNINNATLSGNYSVYNLNTLETKINNSILTGVLENRNSSTMSVESSTIKGYVTNYSTNKVDVKNKSVIDMNGKAYGVYNYSSGTIDLNEVDVKAVENTTNYNVIYNNTGTINATNLNVDITNNTNASTTTSNVVNNNSTGTINLNDFSITSSDLVNSKTLRGIYNNSTGTINLNSGNISIAGGNQSIGLYSQTENGNINFLSGDVTVTGATTSYGAYINNGNITLGTKDEKVNITTPTIKAVGTTGIGAKKVNGYLKFYDGKITGSTSAKPETTTEVEYGYEVHNYTDENGYDYCILEYME